MRHLTIRTLVILCTVALSANVATAAPDAFETPIEASLPDSVTYTNGTAPGSKIITQKVGVTRAVLDWQSFNIGEDAAVEFRQLAGTNSVTVNRVIGGGTDPSKILGKLTANGTVVILDPNGVLFGTQAVIDVGGIVASTGHLANQADFEGGLPMLLADMDAVPGAAVINQSAQFTVRDHGLAAFVAPAVQNNGVITARLGHVTLASGKAATLDFHGDRLIQIAVTDGLSAALPQGQVPVDNSGEIIANGGTVQMTARAASAAVDTVINSDGLIAATHAAGYDGKIILSDGKAADRELQNSIRVGTNNRIQSAVDLAVDGTSVYINSGTYTESLKIGKTISLQPFTAGALVTLMGTRARGDTTPADTLAFINAPDVEINGLTFAYGLHAIQAENADGLFVHDNYFINSFSHAVDVSDTQPLNDLAKDTSNTFIGIGGSPVFFHTVSGNVSPDNNRIFNTPDFGGFSPAPLVIEEAGIDVSALAAIAPAAGNASCANNDTGCGGN